MRLICGDGRSDDFIVEAIGLDMVARGANIIFQRPDFFMPDDIDALHDSLYVVADGQGELLIDEFGKLAAKPARDELGQAQTRWEYPRHRPRETSDGEEKQAAKKDDDIIDTDKALTGRVFSMIKPLSDRERFELKYREIYEQLQRGVA